MEDTIEREKLNYVIAAAINRLTEQQCAGILSELDTAEVNYIIDNNDEWTSKRVLRELSMRRLDAVEMAAEEGTGK